MDEILILRAVSILGGVDVQDTKVLEVLTSGRDPVSPEVAYLALQAAKVYLKFEGVTFSDRIVSSSA